MGYIWHTKRVKDMARSVVVIEKNRANITHGYRRRDYILNKKIFFYQF